ncbi:inositol monophosphatase family protein [Mesobacillus foraminis]|uniref:inositol-phosphate phosphatase n=1 Tax=Mesobacillus foraminis TaxID=279826 RepID=A0A4R2BGX4_9BACI|nr:inositol monophosphatase family protein [Mesobacillus foraminis]TCN25765.1 myo-inositol-1(or 4)-monophosphatase [Mesobacillus foraminis]
MHIDLHEIDTYAKRWIKEAGQRIRDSFPKTLNVTTKSNPNDLVTNIDQETEQFFINKINETFPDHQILGEEGYGDTISKLSGVVWIIDPIDGTMNFVHQQRNFAISIGIYVNGEGRIGLIYDVVHDELYHVIKGNGVFLNDEQIPELEERSVSESIIALNATWVTENKRLPPELLAPLVKAARGTRSYGSAALEMVYVATGRIDAYITPRLAPWDFAAGIIMIEELGGVATNLRGQQLDLLKENSVFVSKPGLHADIMQNFLENGKW